MIKVKPPAGDENKYENAYATGMVLIPNKRIIKNRAEAN